jgi:aminobenzoyl-glutamate utilization protein B
MDKDKGFIDSYLKTHAKEFFPYSDAIWSFAELGCSEYKSSELLCSLLESHGFNVAKGVAQMPTAFVAEWGSGSPTIGFNCEYDALPGLSQTEKGTKEPVVAGAPGHGCGHNILGVGSILAAVALKNWMQSVKATGTVKVFGTPAEEICVGKPFMARDGLFSGCDAILDWHPWDKNGANYDTCNAYFNIKYHFSGRTSHGNSPWEGRSALDTGLLMGHAIEMLREHIPPNTPDAANTVNYTFSDVGPEYASVVPDRCTLWAIGRINNSDLAETIIQRLHKCAEGASIATGTSWRFEMITASHEKIPNKTLASVMHKNLVAIGPPAFDASEIELAKKWQKELQVTENGLSQAVEPFHGGASAVSDNSEFSWFAPFAMVWVAGGPTGIGWHNWQISQCSGGSVGRKAMQVAANVLACSAIDLFKNPDILKEAQKELAESLGGRKYKPLLPDGTAPPIYINEKTMDKYRSLMAEFYKNNPTAK